MRRWRDRKLIANRFVEFNGKPVSSVKKDCKTAVGLARLPGKVTKVFSTKEPMERLASRPRRAWAILG
jgi:hypothetical protein